MTALRDIDLTTITGEATTLGATGGDVTLRGAPALSAFRLDKLAQKLSAIDPRIKVLHTEFVHFAELAAELPDAHRSVLEKLLHYGPEIAEEGHVAEGEDGVALVTRERRYSFVEFKQASDALAAGLRVVQEAADEGGLAASQEAADHQCGAAIRLQGSPSGPARPTGTAPS